MVDQSPRVVIILAPGEGEVTGLFQDGHQEQRGERHRLENSSTGLKTVEESHPQGKQIMSYVYTRANLV